MAKHSLIANKALRYAGQSIAKGSPFSARDARDAHLLTITGAARAVPVADPAAAPVVLTKELIPADPTPVDLPTAEQTIAAMEMPATAPEPAQEPADEPTPSEAAPAPPAVAAPMRASALRGPRGGYKRSEH